MTNIEEEKMVKACELLSRKIKHTSFTVSHRIRGPITTIMGLLDLLKMVSMTDEERDVMLTHLRNAADELDKCSRQLSEYLNVEEY